MCVNPILLSHSNPNSFSHLTHWEFTTGSIFHRRQKVCLSMAYSIRKGGFLKLFAIRKQGWRLRLLCGPGGLRYTNVSLRLDTQGVARTSTKPRTTSWNHLKHIIGHHLQSKGINFLISRRPVRPTSTFCARAALSIVQASHALPPLEASTNLPDRLSTIDCEWPVMRPFTFVLGYIGWQTHFQRTTHHNAGTIWNKVSIRACNTKGQKLNRMASGARPTISPLPLNFRMSSPFVKGYEERGLSQFPCYSFTYLVLIRCASHHYSNHTIIVSMLKKIFLDSPARICWMSRRSHKSTPTL